MRERLCEKERRISGRRAARELPLLTSGLIATESPFVSLNVENACPPRSPLRGLGRDNALATGGDGLLEQFRNIVTKDVETAPSGMACKCWRLVLGVVAGNHEDHVPEAELGMGYATFVVLADDRLESDSVEPLDASRRVSVAQIGE